MHKYYFGNHSRTISTTMDTSLYCNSIDRSAFISYTIKIASVCLCFAFFSCIFFLNKLIYNTSINLFKLIKLLIGRYRYFLPSKARVFSNTSNFLKNLSGEREGLSSIERYVLKIRTLNPIKNFQRFPVFYFYGLHNIHFLSKYLFLRKEM